MGMLSAIAIMGWACQGTTMGPVGVVPITKNAKRTIPLGILITCVVVSIVYGLMSYVAAGVLPYDQMANQNLSVTAAAINPVVFIIKFRLISVHVRLRPVRQNPVIYS